MQKGPGDLMRRSDLLIAKLLLMDLVVSEFTASSIQNQVDSFENSFELCFGNTSNFF